MVLMSGSIKWNQLFRFNVLRDEETLKWERLFYQRGKKLTWKYIISTASYSEMTKHRSTYKVLLGSIEIFVAKSFDRR